MIPAGAVGALLIDGDADVADDVVGRAAAVEDQQHVDEQQWNGDEEQERAARPRRLVCAEKAEKESEPDGRAGEGLQLDQTILAKLVDEHLVLVRQRDPLAHGAAQYSRNVAFAPN